MNIEKKQRIENVFNSIKTYKKNYMSFLKEHNLKTDVLVVEAQTLIFDNYRRDYINKRNLNYLYNDKLEPLKTYIGEAELEEKDIKLKYCVSKVYNSWKSINELLNKTIKDLKNSGFEFGEEPTSELMIWHVKLEDILQLNEIVDVFPRLTEFYVNTYIPQMRDLLGQLNARPSGQLLNILAAPPHRFLILMNEIIGYDPNDSDKVRSRINDLVNQLRSQV